MKLVSTVRDMQRNASVSYGNMYVRKPGDMNTGEADLTFEDLCSEFRSWTTERFVCFVENAKLQKAAGTPLTALQAKSLICRISLTELVRMQEDAASMLFKLGTAAQLSACPLRFDDGASEYAKHGLELFMWNATTKKFDTATLTCYLDTSIHLTRSLLLLGEGALGKSKCIHQLCQELCIAYQKDVYIFTKAIDPLGVASHQGDLRRAAAIALTDFSFSASRGRSYDAESMKALVDCVEGGVIKDTRWRPAQLPPVPRLIALNSDVRSYGEYFRRFEQYGIATMIEAVAAISDPTNCELAKANALREAERAMAGVSSDDQASARRVAIAIVRQSLLAEETVQALGEESGRIAAEGLARRRAHWAARSA
jgi:hypothetical protein